MVAYHASLILAIFHWGRLPNTPQVWRGAFAAWLCLYLLYHAAGNLLGGTVGKRMLGIRVVAEGGGPPGLRESLLRAFGLLLSTPMFNLGFLWAFVHPESRAWHDLLAGTRVVERSPRSPARNLLSALLSLILLSAIVAWTLWYHLLRPAPEDAAAVERAREGLNILARIEEQYKARHGAYTGKLADLALESGDVGQFKAGMREIFDPERFWIAAGRDRYQLKARARDRRRTFVALSGP